MNRKLDLVKTSAFRVVYYRGQVDPWREFAFSKYFSRHGIDLYWTVFGHARSLFIRWYPHVH